MATNDTIVEGVAGRYAAALFDLAKDSSKISEVEADLNKFQSMLDMSDDLKILGSLAGHFDRRSEQGDGCDPGQGRHRRVGCELL